MDETRNLLWPRIMSVAYRMLGGVADADDARKTHLGSMYFADGLSHSVALR